MDVGPRLTLGLPECLWRLVKLLVEELLVVAAVVVPVKMELHHK